MTPSLTSNDDRLFPPSKILFKVTVITNDSDEHFPPFDHLFFSSCPWIVSNGMTLVTKGDQSYLSHISIAFKMWLLDISLSWALDSDYHFCSKQKQNNKKGWGQIGSTADCITSSWLRIAIKVPESGVISECKASSNPSAAGCDLPRQKKKKRETETSLPPASLGHLPLKRALSFYGPCSHLGTVRLPMSMSKKIPVLMFVNVLMSTCVWVYQMHVILFLFWSYI